MSPEGRLSTVPDIRHEPFKPDRPHKDKHVVNKIVGYSVAASIVLSGAGVAIKDFFKNNNEIPPEQSSISDNLLVEPSPTETPEVTAQPSPVETEPAVIVTPEPTLTPTETNNPIESEWDPILVQELAEVIPLEGAKAIIQDNGVGPEVTFIAQANNPYGVEEGEILGVERRNINFEGEQVKGRAYTADVIKKLSDDNNGEFIFIPADISEIKSGEENINVELRDITSKTGKVYKDVLLVTNTNGSIVSISNSIGESPITNTLKMKNDSIPYLINGFCSLSDDCDRYHFDLLGNFNMGDNFQKNLPLGEKLTETANIFSINLNYNDSIASGEVTLYSLESKDVLNNSLLVFMKDNG